MNKIYIGIDPGKEGAIAILHNDNVRTLTFPKIGKEYDINGILRFFKEFEGQNVFVCLEDVHALPGISAKANWSLSRGKTIIETSLHATQLRYEMVAPKTWQKEVWNGVPIQKRVSKKNKSGYKVDTKATSLLAATRLFPNVDLRATERSKVAHGGIVDALLIAEYGRRKF